MDRKEQVRLSLDGLQAHKMRSVLTMLGIIFGVAAVIAMLSIGEGAKQEALRKYQDLGISNIIIRDKELTDEELDEVRSKFSRGLSLADAKAIERILPTVKKVAAQAEIELEARFEDKSTKATLIGVVPAFQDIFNHQPKTGIFLDDEAHALALRNCVIGANVAKKLFGKGGVGQKIKLDDQWFEVIGIMGNKYLFTETVGELAARDLNQDVYIPLSAFLMRFSRENILASELDQVTIKINEPKNLFASSAVIERILNRRHHKNDDFSIVIPFELLRQAEKEVRIYNMVLGAIAAISLLVGGIGVMNIMLASVLERTHEIGIRRALGAKRKEIMTQFLIEAVSLSLVGGCIGIMLGVSMSLFIDSIAEFSTVITPWSIILAFGVSCCVGIVFGTYPAKNAANVNPIEALRYE